MITFTKEQLIASAHARIEFAEMMLAGELEPLKERTWSIELELARIALASLEAEAVCVIDQSNLDYLKSGSDADVWPASRAEMGDVLLYRTAHPAPVSVPDEDLLHMAASAIDDLLSNKDRSGAGVWADIPAKLRRAAMLQGAEPVQGWIPCSERMPEFDTSVLLYFPDYGGHIESGCIGDEGDGPYHYFFDGDSLRHEPTHWMPLPAAPQQEVKK